MDRGQAKREIVAKLVEWGTSFIDTTMGVDVDEGSLAGILKVITVTPRKGDHLHRITFSDANQDDDYSRSIQIAELNALSAALAVIRWKKHLGFYRDLGHEHCSTYTVDLGMLLNEDGA